jgi:hypothetical protein
LPVSMDAPKAASMLKLDTDGDGKGDGDCASSGCLDGLDRELEVKMDRAEFLERKLGLSLLPSGPLAVP